MKLKNQIVVFSLIVVWGTPSLADSTGTAQAATKTESESPTSSPRREAPTYKLHPAYDSAAIIIGGMVAGSWLLGDEFGSAHCAPLCEKSEVNRVDRFAAGNYDQTWARISDVTLITTLVSGLLLVSLDEGFPAALTDGLVVAESVILANATIVLLNLATRRPRPYLFSDKAPISKRERGRGALSFPSGHVGATAAMASAVFGLVHLRHPQSPWKWVVLGVGAVATGLVATGRVLSGRHFLTDVLAGAAIGAGMGILIPALHKRNVSLIPLASSNGFSLGFLRRF